jgi:hypothetical protein
VYAGAVVGSRNVCLGLADRHDRIIPDPGRPFRFLILVCVSPGANRRFAIFVIACQELSACEGKLAWARYCRLSQDPEPSLTT